MGPPLWCLKTIVFEYGWVQNDEKKTINFLSCLQICNTRCFQRHICMDSNTNKICSKGALVSDIKFRNNVALLLSFAVDVVMLVCSGNF